MKLGRRIIVIAYMCIRVYVCVCVCKAPRFIFFSPSREGNHEINRRERARFPVVSAKKFTSIPYLRTMRTEKKKKKKRRYKKKKKKERFLKRRMRGRFFSSFFPFFSFFLLILSCDGFALLNYLCRTIDIDRPMY